MKFALIISLLLCATARASITYDVQLDTSNLPKDSQVELYLSNLTDNWSRAKTVDGFQIDGDLIQVYDHYYADQPTFNVAPPVPVNFNLTLTGAAGSSDYFLLAIRAPDGSIITGPDGSDWLAWSAMDQDSPILNLDFPAPMTVAVAPEPTALMFLPIAALALLIRKPRCA